MADARYPLRVTFVSVPTIIRGRFYQGNWKYEVDSLKGLTNIPVERQLWVGLPLQDHQGAICSATTTMI